MESGAIAYIRQNRALGLGHAVWCARRLIGDEPFAVILTDDVIHSDVPCLKQMVDAYQDTGGNMVAAMEVTPEQTSSYGILDAQVNGERTVKVNGMVEKPAPGTAPSNLAVIGRYILGPEIMGHLNEMKVGAGGEIQLTDAIAEEIANGAVHGFRFDGKRYDCGNKSGFLRATVAFAMAREDLRDDMAEFLQETVDGGL
jgi:UTP--glucose-1-phosphate uridylyltransferase